MTLLELSKLIASKNMLLIRVEALSNHRDDLSFIGTLNEYLDAVKILGANAIFVSTISITEERFTYSPKRIPAIPGRWPFPSSSEDEELVEYDMCSVVPELERYKEKVGWDGYFELSAHGLTYSIYEEWMQEMEVLCVDAQELIDQEIQEEEDAQLAAEEAENAEEIAKLEGAVKKLHSLAADPQFARLPTQRAMRAYAIDKIPELENLDEAELKREIQDLTALIQARGAGRNSR